MFIYIVYNILHWGRGGVTNHSCIHSITCKTLRLESARICQNGNIIDVRVIARVNACEIRVFYNRSKPIYLYLTDYNNKQFRKLLD